MPSGGCSAMQSCSTTPGRTPSPPPMIENWPSAYKEREPMKAAFQKSHSMGDGESIVPVFFFEPQRGVPKLSRGWRTPDPSPTRDASGLPRCAPKEIHYGIAHNAKDEEQTTPRDRRGTMYQQRCLTINARTPSPPPMIDFLPSAHKELERTELTLRNSHLSDEEDAVQRYICSGSGVDDNLALNIPTCSPSSIPLVVFPVIPAVIMPFTIPDENGCGPAMASAGSAGHPHTCGQPCKYWTKKRGCKDGAKCDHCHLCDWKPAHGRKGKNSRKAKKGANTSVDSDSERLDQEAGSHSDA